MLPGWHQINQDGASEVVEGRSGKRLKRSNVSVQRGLKSIRTRSGLRDALKKLYKMYSLNIPVT